MKASATAEAGRFPSRKSINLVLRRGSLYISRALLHFLVAIPQTIRAHFQLFQAASFYRAHKRYRFSNPVSYGRNFSCCRAVSANRNCQTWLGQGALLYLHIIQETFCIHPLGKEIALAHIFHHSSVFVKLHRTILSERTKQEIGVSGLELMNVLYIYIYINIWELNS